MRSALAAAVAGHTLLFVACSGGGAAVTPTVTAPAATGGVYARATADPMVSSARFEIGRLSIYDTAEQELVLYFAVSGGYTGPGCDCSLELLAPPTPTRLVPVTLPPGDYSAIDVGLLGSSFRLADGRTCTFGTGVSGRVPFNNGVLHVDASTSKTARVLIDIPVVSATCEGNGQPGELTFGPMSASATPGIL